MVRVLPAIVMVPQSAGWGLVGRRQPGTAGTVPCCLLLLEAGQVDRRPDRGVGAVAAVQVRAELRAHPLELEGEPAADVEGQRAAVGGDVVAAVRGGGGEGGVVVLPPLDEEAAAGAAAELGGQRGPRPLVVEVGVERREGVDEVAAGVDR